MATHVLPPSVPDDQFLNPTNRHYNGAMRIGGQQQQLGIDNGDWTRTRMTSKARQRRKWGLFDGDISVSEGQRGKRKASYDAPEKTRKKLKFFDYLEDSHGEHFAPTSSTTSDARCVDFGSPQEVTQSDTEDHSYLVPMHPLPHFLPDGLAGFGVRDNFEQPDRAVTQSDQSLHESLTPQVEIFEEHPSLQERFVDMFDIAHIQDPTRTWQPRCNLSHDPIFQHGGGEIFAPHQDQCDLGSFTPHFEYPPERLAKYLQFNHSLTWNTSHGHYFQNVDQLYQHTSFDGNPAQQGGFDASGCGHVDQYAQGDNYALQGLGTRMIRSVENFLILHLLTRKPQLSTIAKFRPSSKSASPCGSSTQVISGKEGEIYLVHIMFLLET